MTKYLCLVSKSTYIQCAKTLQHSMELNIDECLFTCRVLIRQPGRMITYKVNSTLRTLRQFMEKRLASNVLSIKALNVFLLTEIFLGTGCEMYTETLSPSFTGMSFNQAAE